MDNPELTQEPEIIIDHFQQLITDYGLNDQNNTVGIYKYNADTRQNELIDQPIFEKVPEGIAITPYTLDRKQIKAPTYKGSRWNGVYKIIRLHPEQMTSKGLKKYHIPSGGGTPPFFPVQLLEAYEKGTTIDVLYVTEGYKKAFKSCNSGLPCVGLVSITCMVDKETNKLHRDIVKLIDKCKVKRVVWLIDADYSDISSKEIEDGANLTRRPDAFFNTIVRFQELLSGLDDISIYFAHISDTIDGNPKGIDDLLIEHKESEAEIIKEALQFDKINQGMHTGNYFVKFNITQSPYRVKKHFRLHDVTEFYLYHITKRPELKGKLFKFYNSTYIYAEKTGKCEIQVPRDAANYFRVGDDYYEYLNIPNRYKELTRTFHNRQKSTITDDHGKEILRHIDKYKAFCNVPDHLNYQRVINNCFNTYAPFLHEPEAGEYDQTIDFIKHIFGTNKIILSNGREIEYYELGLDYLQLLLKKPQQILPILCLVSQERQTGKTTYAKWLKLLFTENMAIVGNQDFENAFNAHWITKLLVCVDETKIDKEFVVEKIKSLSTSNNTMLNAKGKNQIEVETFLKFILLSNNESNFINIDKDEIRFWVLKVPSISTRTIELEKVLLDEIPAFINFLNNRKMVTDLEERHWFKTDYLQTDTLRMIKENSLPTAWKLLKHTITEKFLDCPEIDEIRIPLKELKNYYLNNPRFDESYIERVLKQQGFEREHNQRGSFPLHHSADEIAALQFQKFNGRPFVFKRSDFIENARETGDLPF